MKRICLIMMMLCFVCGQVFGAFVKPTDQQINEAAADPSKLTALLQDATPKQAAEIVALVMKAVVGLKLPADQQDARVTSVVQTAVTAMGAQATAFARFLGSAVGTTPEVAPLGAKVSSVLKSSVGVGAANAFSNALKHALKPPVPGGYRAQDID